MHGAGLKPPASLGVARSSVAGLCLAIGCAPPAAPIAEAARCTYVGAPRAEADAKYNYRVAAAPQGEELCVEVDVPKGAARRWAPEAPLSPFVRDVAMAGEGSFAPVGTSAGAWVVPACREDRGCRLRYRVKLAEAAQKLDDFELAEQHRGAILAPPSSWLLRPMETRAPFRAEVITPPGTRFLTGLARDGASTYVGDVGALDDTPYAMFGALAARSMTLPGGVLDIAIAPGNPEPAARGAIEAWIDRSARAVADYFEGFPIPRAAILVKLVAGKGAGSGHTMGGGGGAILISAGESSTIGDFDDDWILVHEMLHLAFPDVRRPWAEEGLSTYVESIVRARAGMCTAEDMWHSLLEGMPQGQPEAGDRGLDETHTWGRHYWGGAMFWLVADVKIRQRTEGRRSLDDVLRAVSRRGGNISVRWDLDRVLAIGDEAVGVEVLRPLREELGRKPQRVDLEGLWRGLGVSMSPRGQVLYDDGAALAHIRRAIAAKPKREGAAR